MQSASISEIVSSLSEEEALKVKRLLEKGIKIPPQPRVLEDLRQLLLRREFDIRQLARVISQDPGIVSMLYKVTASSAYRQHQPFESLEQILHTLGVKQTYNFVLAIGVAATSSKSENRAALEAYWSRSQSVAQIAMLVANDRVMVCNIFPDQAYMAGVFHDCGVPILMDRFQTYCREMRLGAHHIWIDLQEEDAKFNADHSVVGYLVARHWNLPDFACEAVRYHHDTESEIPYAARSMVSILQLATEIFCRDRHIENPEWPGAKFRVLDELGISEEGLPEFIDIVLERYHEQTERAE